MFLRQISDRHLSQYAYLIGCQETDQAILIDPQRDIDRYRAAAKEEGLEIIAAAETHLHADFMSGTREFSTDPAMRIYLSAEGGPDWQYEWARGLENVTLLRDGDSFRIGNILFSALHTPGHAPEHLSYLVTDTKSGADEPIVLLSGDFLFVGDVGRPDLLEALIAISGAGKTGALQLYASLRKILNLPPHLQVLPGHGAGSSCGKALSAVPQSTIGYEAKFNPAFRLALEGKENPFVDFILSGQAEPPPYFVEMKRTNQQGPPLLGGLPKPSRLSVSEMEVRVKEPGVIVLDTRADRAAFMAAHLPGSLHAPVRGGFDDVAGGYVQREERIILLVDSGAEVEGLVRRLIRIGRDQIDGWVLSADALEKRALSSIQTIPFSYLPACIENESAPLLLDVRRTAEYKAGHLRGALRIGHKQIRRRAAEIPSGKTVIVHCQSGIRAALAAAWLERGGRKVIYVNDAFENAPPASIEAS